MFLADGGPEKPADAKEAAEIPYPEPAVIFSKDLSKSPSPSLDAGPAPEPLSPKLASPESAGRFFHSHGMKNSRFSLPPAGTGSGGFPWSNDQVQNRSNPAWQGLSRTSLIDMLMDGPPRRAKGYARVNALSELKSKSPSNVVHGNDQMHVFLEKKSFGSIPKVPSREEPHVASALLQNELARNLKQL